MSVGVAGPALVAPPVAALRRIEGRAFARHFEAKYRHPLRKALYFARHEGIGATVRKARSKSIERRIEEEGALVVAGVEAGGGRLLGLTHRIGERCVFHRSLLFRVAAGQGPDAVVLTDRAQQMLESYLPVPSCPLPAALPAEILAANPFLSPAAEEAALDAFAVEADRGTPAAGPGHAGRGGVYLLGFGSYVREQVLPHFAGAAVLALDYRAEPIRRHLPLAVPVTASFDEVLARVRTEAAPLVVVATYHADHAAMALAVLEANPAARVFVEKPPAMTPAEAETMAAARKRGAWLDVGFNRRYARLTTLARERCRTLPRPLVFSALVKELKLPPTHWYFWPNQGTRITGNVCHWIDLAYHLIERPATELSLLSSGDSVSLAIAFADGSLATIVATDRGDDLPGVTERIEIRGGETTITIDDFRRLEVRSGEGTEVRRLWHRDKGHAAMYRDLRRRWTTGGVPRYPVEDLRRVTSLTATAAEMLRSGRRHQIVGGDAEAGGRG